MYYAIEIIGYGKRTRYTVKRITENGTICPTDGKTYRTETEARAAARVNGYEIAKCGDLWQII